MNLWNEIEYIGSNIDSDGKREIERLQSLNETFDLSEKYISPYNLSKFAKTGIISPVDESLFIGDTLIKFLIHTFSTNRKCF